MPLPLFIFLILLFLAVLGGAWYYYTWTPEGRVKDAESKLKDHKAIAEAANTMLEIQTVSAETVANLQVHKYDPRAQKFNPVKNLDKVHPEARDIPEVCGECHEYKLDDICINAMCSEDK